jgi:hypothetical protein
MLQVMLKGQSRYLPYLVNSEQVQSDDAVA